MLRLSVLRPRLGRMAVRHLSSSPPYSDEYQFLHHSELPTDVFQASLPRLPIPTIENTCQRYLNAQKPLLTDEQFAHTQDVTLRFQQGIGKNLQLVLRKRDKANKHTSYISKPWFDMYLTDRRPIVINSNPFMSYIDDPDTPYNDQVIRATNMTIAALRFMRTLEAGILTPEVFHLNAAKSDVPGMRKLVKLLPRRVASFGAYYYKAFPLDMSQFSSLFASTRVPRIGKDELKKTHASKHILVIRNGHLYAVDVMDASGDILSPADIHGSIASVANDPSPPPESPLGYLSAENRDTWAAVREHLLETGNGEALEAVDSALFCIVLDDARINDDPVAAFKQFLHGDAANRWFDKSFSIVFSGEGKAAINFEHAWGDGVAVLRLFNEIFRDVTEKPRVGPDSHPGTAHVRRLEWKLDGTSKQAIADAKKRFWEFADSVAIGMFMDPRYGKDICKQSRISPDAVMQMGFQVAYHRLTGQTVASYESCSTSAFLHGRTETIRPATEATLALSRALNSSTRPERAQLRQLMEDCSKRHGELTVNAAKGQGCDRHLFALRLLAEELEDTMPDFYKDPAFQPFNRFKISTSTLSTPYVETGGFGAVEADGFGIGYSIRERELGAMISNYPAHTDVDSFVDCLESTFHDLHDILVPGS
ncbi:Carnitine O-palmitoyltransferase 2, mitochondrial [Amphibalanus amphitrite]|uniref:Carnitine O-palmitoyltransferase 2, mitochondrial n=1 Tax=Amphibalanus amphitrite TaxID=1232801 RepID=A0A6A4V0K1_AMPAM|nr:carnitine O-palmitoyltransferase 2, mitochondrial-like [Amphibalanus amphitrite]XP_043218210.1 carnitine O-palmitoyltransferase 2, mitochondrial-like [Amphibalanus amphitrite]XP_043218211.1 carnitine O-palmitoyltransferase 2, mitochondrial-like [Amphibalanus amphitrite]XP_043218213.1 carnitine O-palmitoyltransferase 2, mitochondrial-like [Amphibalanus amphitrite]XP_043218214.1 carnitine O-palmitoyltransferase 2, mitochondrial-like [Amphibalanus amphitrite]XP_043218215.1 carnitine O-palmitoy